MLMMGFFVILWVLKPNVDPKKEDSKSASQQEEQWLDTVSEIRGAFGWEPNPASKDQVDQRAIQKRERQGEGKGGGKVERKPHGAEGLQPEVESIRRGKQAIIGTRIQFDAGKNTLDGPAKNSLGQMVKLIQGHEQLFIVKGHASLDDFPDGGGLKTEAKALAEFRMTLSMKRAQLVADYLSGAGVEPRVLRVQGCSTFEPVSKRAYTEEKNAHNRRVEVESSDNTLTEVQDSAKTTNVMPPGLKTESAATSTDTVDHR